MQDFLGHERLVHGPWPAFERALARLIEHAGFRDIAIVGGPGDLGADIVGTLDTQRWVIQAKFKRSGGVDSDGIEEAVRASNSYDAQVCVAATNQRFTENAHRRTRAFRSSGIDARLWDRKYLLKYAQRLPVDSIARPTLRPYQSRAVDSIYAARSSEVPSALYVMATGLGKTLVAAEIIRLHLDRDRDSEVLVLAHTVDLVRQLEQAMWRFFDKGTPTHLWTDGESPSFAGGVTFATWQSIAARLRIEGLHGRYPLIVVDEAHHAPSRKYRRLLEALEPEFMLGATATPWRMDRRLMSDLFGDPIFSMDIVEGMQDGYLADVDYRMMVDDIDWDEVYRLSQQGYSIRDLNARLIMPERDEAVVSRLISAMRSIEEPRVLCFCRTISHAEHFTRMLLAFGIGARVLHSGLSRTERFRTLSGFRVGDFPVLMAVDVLNEGIDLPAVNLVAFMRVTHSRRIFVQQLGRGLRLAPGKRSVTILDFVADIRRIAAGLVLNRQAALRGRETEVLRFGNGRIVQFEGEIPSEFASEFLSDVLAIDDADDSARLVFPEL